MDSAEKNKYKNDNEIRLTNVDPVLKQKIIDISKSEGKSLSHYVKIIIRKHIEQCEKK